MQALKSLLYIPYFSHTYFRSLLLLHLIIYNIIRASKGGTLGQEKANKEVKEVFLSILLLL